MTKPLVLGAMPIYDDAMAEKTQYALWRQHMGWTHERAAQELDISELQSRNYERGADRTRGNTCFPPRSVRLHMRILVDKLDITPWPEQ